MVLVIGAFGEFFFSPANGASASMVCFYYGHEAKSI
jgi:hypothetical protein